MNALHHLRTTSLCVAIAASCFAPGAAAQQSGHAGMQMPMPMPAPAESASKHPPATRPKAAHPQHARPQKPMPMPMPPAPASSEPSPPAPMQKPMDMPAEMPAGAVHAGADEPRTPIPPLTEADRAAAMPPPSDHPVHDNPVESYTLFNRLEGWNADPGTGVHWEGTSWIGTDLNRLWLRTEGERRDGTLESADLELLYGHSVATWWDVLVGLRHDFKPGASRDFAAFGVTGRTPYKFEVSATAYVGQSGQTAARIEAEYDTLFTNRLILQPLVEVNLYGESDPARGVGSGLSTVEAGLRLRYEVTRRFAPYVGVVHEQAYGRTADFRQAEGEDSHETRVVAGIRFWF